MSLNELRQFPQGFLWGCATSAHQVEGQNVNDWSRWEQIPGHIFQNQRSGRACDWWAGRFAEDFDRAAEMHYSAHRLSVEWSRIEPEPGRLDDQALNHYSQMILALCERGIVPMITLHHFTLYSGSHCGAAGEHFLEQRMGLADSEVIIVHPSGAIEMAAWWLHASSEAR